MTDEMLELARRNAAEAGRDERRVPQGPDRGDPARRCLRGRRHQQLRDQPVRRQGRRPRRDRPRPAAGRPDRASATSSPTMRWRRPSARRAAASPAASPARSRSRSTGPASRRRASSTSRSRPRTRSRTACTAPSSARPSRPDGRASDIRPVDLPRPTLQAAADSRSSPSRRAAAGPAAAERSGRRAGSTVERGVLHAHRDDARGSRGGRRSRGRAPSGPRSPGRAAARAVHGRLIDGLPPDRDADGSRARPPAPGRRGSSVWAFSHRGQLGASRPIQAVRPPRTN